MSSSFYNPGPGTYKTSDNPLNKSYTIGARLTNLATERESRNQPAPGAYEHSRTQFLSPGGTGNHSNARISFTKGQRKTEAEVAAISMKNPGPGSYNPNLKIKTEKNIFQPSAQRISTTELINKKMNTPGPG